MSDGFAVEHVGAHDHGNARIAFTHVFDLDIPRRPRAFARAQAFGNAARKLVSIHNGVSKLTVQPFYFKPDPKDSGTCPHDVGRWRCHTKQFFSNRRTVLRGSRSTGPTVCTASPC